MFSKILIAEDHESSNFSVQKVLEELKIPNVDYVYYCDDALAYIKKALENELPYDLLITDLSFEEDHRTQLIKNGRELIKCCRDICPELNIIVFSGEHRVGVIDLLFKEFNINSYVKKARSDSSELKKAIETVYNGNSYISHNMKFPIKSANTLEFSNFDITLLKLLSDGILQKNIPKKLQEQNIYPNSLSSVEKRINMMKLSLAAANTEELIAFGKNIGII
ncbi:response regulator [Epilithonimonas pallida]|uniref:DNA-binding response regulator, NarL/FixJ family, contains REC and HTH domains n=1 Tax=Epilithonimonas pallida TaxID=373671 RepID=A0ABY1QZ51_9FLAO|nr:response regulator [Epilithonimonas pallida]SMP90223.1 DNA-binding response regulator, NarL/FixJ family, contains REC and HTH domains [Epilithonimonas pallida]